MSLDRRPGLPSARQEGRAVVHEKPPPLVIGRGITVREGSDVCLLGMGNMVAPALDAAALLDGRGISAMVVSMHTVKPLDEMLLREVFERFAVVAVVEEHSRIGGLGSAVGAVAAARASPRPGGPLACVRHPRRFPPRVGKPAARRASASA